MSRTIPDLPLLSNASINDLLVVRNTGTATDRRIPLSGVVPSMTITQLKALTEPVNGQVAIVTETGRAGTFVFDSSGTGAENSGTTFTATDSTPGLWRRRFSGFADLRWWGSLADYKAAIQSALDAGIPVYVPAGTWVIASTLELRTGSVIEGGSSQTSILSYTGAGVAMRSQTLGVRTYGWALSNFTLDDAGTGTVGIELDSVSVAVITEVRVSGFGVQFDIYSPTAGFSIYNRFYACLAVNGVGYRVRGSSSNANVFTACRTNLCTEGVRIENSNDNSLIGCQFESGTDGVVITASTAGVSDSNRMVSCRFETNSGDAINIGANVRDTLVTGGYFITTGGAFVDNGSRTMVRDNQGVWQDRRTFPLRTANGNLFFECTQGATSSEPLAVFRDSSSTSGTPSTVEIQTERNAGLAFSVKRAGDIYFGLEPNGRIRTASTAVNVNTPSGATARQLPIYDAAGALLGYIPVYAAAW